MQDNIISTVKHTNTGEFLYDNCNDIAKSVIEEHYILQPELSNYGEKGKKHSLQDCRYHIFYLGESICLESEAIFLDYMRWTRVLFNNLSIPEKYLISNLQVMKEVLLKYVSQNILPEENYNVINNYIDLVLEDFDNEIKPNSSYINQNYEHGKLAAEYLNYLLDGKRNDASKLIFHALDDGVSMEEIYLNIFQPAQYEVGRLWQTNKISVAKEHYITASTQQIMSQLYPRIICSGKNNKTAVATCIGSELHELGVRMVADFFEMGGWDSYYLGANTPSESIIQAIKETKASIVIISTTLSVHIHKVKELIQKLRSSDDMKEVKIMVGGHPFSVDSDLWKKIGADFTASDASEALKLANGSLNNYKIG